MPGETCVQIAVQSQMLVCASWSLFSRVVGRKMVGETQSTLAPWNNDGIILNGLFF